MIFTRARTLLAASLLTCAGPVLADDNPPPLDAYGDLPGVEDMAISPNGKGLAFIARVKGKRMVVITGEGNKVRMSAPLEDMKVHSVNWAGDDIAWLYTSSTQNLGYGFTESKHEFYGAILLYPETRNVDMVFKGIGKIANSVFGYHGMRMVDGKLKGYFGGVELVRDGGRGDYVFDHGRPALFAVDFAKNSPKKVAKSAGEDHWRDWLVDGDGEVAATLDVSSNTASGRSNPRSMSHLPPVSIPAAASRSCPSVRRRRRSSMRLRMRRVESRAGSKFR